MSPVGASYKSTNKADFKKNRFKNNLPCFQKNRRQENRPDKAVFLIEFQITMIFFNKDGPAFSSQIPNCFPSALLISQTVHRRSIPAIPAIINHLQKRLIPAKARTVSAL